MTTAPTVRVRGITFTAWPGILLDRLLPLVIDLLNELMTATPVERLSGVSLQPRDLVPPRGRGEAFGECERQSIRWQLGL
jgi:hypothetical protein